MNLASRIQLLPRFVTMCQPRKNISVSSISRGSNVDVSIDDKGVATLSMNKAPVNSLNKEFLIELNETLETTSKSAKGLVLTSSMSSVFCAGLEITEMYQPDPVRLREFWSSLQDLWIQMYSYKLPSAAAITGHSPAGGCLLSMCCDYRVMVGPKYSIGLNETLLGIVAPFWFKDSMQNTIGFRQTELALMKGTLFSTEEALKVGLIDKAVTSREECLTEANNFVKGMMKIPSEARHVSKMLMRGKYVDQLVNNKEQDIDHFVNFVTKPEIQKPLGMYLEALKAKSKKK